MLQSSPIIRSPVMSRVAARLLYNPSMRCARTALRCAPVQASLFRERSQRNLFPLSRTPSVLQTLHSSALTRSPRQRHWSDAEPARPEDLVNPNGRIYSVRPEPADERFEETLGPARPPSATRAFLFFCFGSLATYGVAGYISNSETSSLASSIRASSARSWGFGDFSSFFGGGGDASADGLSERQLRAAKKHELAERLGMRLEWIVGWCDQLGLPQSVKEVVGRSYVIMAENYLNLPDSRRTVIGIIGLNAVVFGLWRLGGLGVARGRLEAFMARNFLHSPASGRTYTMLTSTFSHRGGLHFLFNNIALWSIGATAFLAPAFLSHIPPSSRMPESSITPHFWSFFISAGLFAALASHAVCALRFRRAASLIGPQRALASVGRQSSLGSSGAIYAALVMSACAFPDARVSLIFLPFLSFPIGWGVSGMVALDMLGAARGWALFDHYAHLGGAAFGLAYFQWGQLVWENAKRVAAGKKEVKG